MGTIIWGALTAGKRTNLLALACLISTLVAVDGPLLQQSSKVVSMPIPEDEGTAVTLTFELSPELPSYYTGIVNFTALPGWLSSDGDARATQTYVQGPSRDQVLTVTRSLIQPSMVKSVAALDPAGRQSRHRHSPSKAARTSLCRFTTTATRRTSGPLAEQLGTPVCLRYTTVLSRPISTQTSAGLWMTRSTSM